MNLSLKKYSHLQPFAVLLLLGTFLTVLSQYSHTGLYPLALAWGIGLDFIVTLPLLYLFLIWKHPIPKLSVGLVIFLGSFLAYALLPLEQITFFAYFQALFIPFLEFTMLGWLGYQLYKVYQRYPRGEEVDIFEALLSSCRKIIPGLVGRLLATEFATLYYGFFASRPPQPNSRAFTYHRESGVVAVLGVLIFLILMETLALHLLLQLWSSTGALLLTILGLYTALQFWGILRSLPQRLIRIDQEKGFVQVNFGIMSEARIPLDHIKDWKAKPGFLAESLDYKELSPLGSLGGSYNFLIRLEYTGEIQGFYGKKIPFQNLVFFVDEPEAFADALSESRKS